MSGQLGDGVTGPRDRTLLASELVAACCCGGMAPHPLTPTCLVGPLLPALHLPPGEAPGEANRIIKDTAPLPLLVVQMRHLLCASVFPSGK